MTTRTKDAANASNVRSARTYFQCSDVHTDFTCPRVWNLPLVRPCTET